MLIEIIKPNVTKITILLSLVIANKAIKLAPVDFCLGGGGGKDLSKTCIKGPYAKNQTCFLARAVGLLPSYLPSLPVLALLFVTQVVTSYNHNKIHPTFSKF